MKSTASGDRLSGFEPVSELAPLAEIILAHHERWNETGCDAMTSERPYRKAMSEDAAVEEIRRNAETQIDPVIAELFIEKVLGGKGL